MTNARLYIVPASRSDVAAFIARTHRHHKPPVGDVFRLALIDGSGEVRGVASVGRPVARMLDDGWTLEINRVATDGVRNGCSLLYGACRRIAWTMGYRRIVTYTLPEEGGASLRAAGWACDGQVRPNGMGWESRDGRVDAHPGAKLRWSCVNPDGSTVDPVWPSTQADAQERLFA